MSKLSPEISEPTPESQSAEIKPFDSTQTTLRAVSYGHLDRGLKLEPEVTMSDRDTLWQANPIEDRSLSIFPGAHAIPHEDVLLRSLVFYGTTESFQLRDVWKLKMAIQDIQKLTADLEAIAGMQEAAVALRGVSEAATARRQNAKEAYFLHINAYIESMKLPYWVIVDTEGLEATENLPADYAHSHNLAQLAGIDFTEDGTVRTLMHQADGSVGYTTGARYLYW